MSHHVGRVHSSNGNERSPGVVVSTSVEGVEINCDTPRNDGVVILDPQDVRVLMALLGAAADNVERIRSSK